MNNFIKKLTSKLNFYLNSKSLNKNFRIPILNNIGFDNYKLIDGRWKLDFFKKFNNSINKDFIDIGANIGQTLLMYRSIYNHSRYIGIEPNYNCCYYLHKLIEANQIKNSVIVPVGLFNQNKLMSFQIQGDSDQGGTLVENLRPGNQYVENFYVPVFDFETIKTDLNITDVYFIKIDVEGAELFVLKAIESFMINIKPVILCEILWAHNNDKLSDNKIRNDEIIKLLHRTGYKIAQIIKSDDVNEIKEFKLITDLENKVYSMENRDECDYIFYHPENSDQLKQSFTIL